MKIRQDFVSNSSSSSFIIAKTDIFTYFKIGKEIIKEAIDDLWIGDEIDENETSDMNKPYVVYEMPKDRAIAVRTYGHLLSCWNQNYPYIEDCWDPDRDAAKEYEKLIAALNRVSTDWYFFNGDDEDLEHSNAPDYVKKTIKDAREKLNIKKADEILLDDNTQLFIHFADNEIANIRGMDEDGKDEVENKEEKDILFDTPSHSCERFIEILFKWLVKHNKIDPKDKELLKLYPLAEYCKNNMPEKISWLKDDTYSWKDFLEEGVVHEFYHEG